MSSTVNTKSSTPKEKSSGKLNGETAREIMQELIARVDLLYKEVREMRIEEQEFNRKLRSKYDDY